jgi:gluconolactonase
MKTSTIIPRSIIKFQNLLYPLLFLSLYSNVSFAQDPQSDIIPAGSTLTKLSSDQFIFTEGPVWYHDSVMLFTDDGINNPPNIFQYNPITNQFSNWPNNGGHCLGLTCDKDGNLLACSTTIIMMNEAGDVSKTVISTYDGKPFNNPNDLIADNKRGVYFTDPDYFIVPTQDKKAVYYIDSTGYVTRVIVELDKPNGIVLSPDGTRLYVVDANTNYIYSWEVAADGSVSGKAIFAELQATGGSLAGSDGMTVDINGNIYTGTDQGVQIFSPQGEAIAIIETPTKASNCDFGGPDFKTLYITSRKNLYSIELNYPGFAVSRQFNSIGINSMPDKPLVTFYPNPTSSQSTIELLSTPQKNTTMTIINSNGQQIISCQITEQITVIDVSGLIDGVYSVCIMDDQNVSSVKFVKQ